MTTHSFILLGKPPLSPMSRRLEQGVRRRSPRISALEEYQKSPSGHNCGEDQRGTRTRVKRKIDACSLISTSKKLAKQVWKGRDNPQAEHHLYNCQGKSGGDSQMAEENLKDVDRAMTDGKASVMPAKHTLELVIDTLQRRDTHEIFAEPVDADEVEDYYKIIKEPMDFGTMRAKLHEGMYETLEQFEHDVLLIPENAMHFNSSATIYFRQARIIHELAKKIFHALKTNPENFVLEFSGTRRRSMRKALSDTRARSGTISSDVSSKGTLQSPLGSSTFRRTSKKNQDTTSYSCSRDFLTGKRNISSSSREVADRRFTWRSPLYHDKDSLGSTSDSSFRPLVLMNQGDTGYRNSIMSFVKDLGPIAQAIAKQKLFGQDDSNCWICTEKCEVFADVQWKSCNAFRTFRDFASGCDSFVKASNTVNLSGGGEEANESKREKGTHRGAPAKEKSKRHTTSVARGVLNIHGTRQAGDTRSMETKRVFSSSNPVLLNMNFPFSRSKRNAGKFNDNVRPVILALEHSRSNVVECKSRNKRSCIPSVWSMPPKTDDSRPDLMSHTAVAVGRRKEPQQALEVSKPVPSPFIFDLPFLKAQLSQMNAKEREGPLIRWGFQGGVEWKRPSLEKIGFERALNCT